MVPNTTSVNATTAEAPLILALDSGSSSTRVLLYDRRGQAVESVLAQEPYQLRTAADAALERAARCVDAALSQAGPLAHQISAVVVDTLVSNILAIDHTGRPLTP